MNGIFLRFAATAALTALMAVPAAAVPTKQALMELANRAAGVCAQSMPDSIATGNALKSVGFSLKDSDGRAKIYAAENYRVLVLISAVGGNDEVCAIAVSRMTPSEATALITPWLQQTNARPFDQKPGLTRWIGTFQGAPLILGVVDHINLEVMNGAAIIAGAPHR